jgi:hypothetical protein
VSEFYNEAGEPLMSGEQMRREMEIDGDPMTYYCDDCGFCHGGECRG